MQSIMRKACFFPIVVSAFALVATCATASAQKRWECPTLVPVSNPIAPSPAAIEKGRQLASVSCAQCHGENGTGKSAEAAGLKTPPPSWRTREFQSQSDACIFWKISTGHGDMPATGAAPEKERWLMLTFIRSLGEK